MVEEIKKDLRIYNNASMLLFWITIFVRKRVASHSCPFTRPIRASPLSPPPHSLHSIFPSVLFYSPFLFFFIIIFLISLLRFTSVQLKRNTNAFESEGNQFPCLNSTTPIIKLPQVDSCKKEKSVRILFFYSPFFLWYIINFFRRSIIVKRKNFDFLNWKFEIKVCNVKGQRNSRRKIGNSNWVIVLEMKYR